MPVLMEHSNAVSDIKHFQEILGYTFKNEALLVSALTHPSFAYEAMDKNTEDNSRLEFFGDSVLGMVIAEDLYNKNPNYSEGDLTRERATLVNKSALTKKAKEIGLGGYLRLGKGEAKTGGRSNPTNLSGAIEAVIAALFIDGGLEEAKKFILRVII